MKRECETCIKRKTPYCPTSIDCMATDDMPYYQNIIMLLEENQELKKQVEELSKNYNLDIPGIYIVSRNDEIIRLDKKALQYLRSLEQKNYKLENQQKEFIKYLEDEINKLVKEYGNYVYDDYSEEKGKYDSYQEILQKYKEIIGVSDENRK